MILTLVLDRASKILVVRFLPFEVPVAPVAALAKIFTFTYIHNTGAAFGMLPQAGIVFAFVQAIVAVALVIWYDRLPVRHLLVRIAVGLVSAGAVGNLIDRLHTGYVVDFLHFHFWPIFNLADSAVVAGVVVLGAYMLFGEDAAEKPTERRGSLERGQPGGA